MNQLSKRTWMMLAVFVAVAGGASLFITNYYDKLEQAEQQIVSRNGSEAVSSGTAPAKGGTANQVQVYTKLVSEYKDRRIQFDINCQAVPNNVTFKNGTKVMFDNRSGDARIIIIGGTKYNFSGYGYKILTLSSSSLPKNLLLSCGSAVNVGQILLQK